MASKAKPATRAEKQEATRRRLLEAAAQQIGAEGYAGASIHKITALAEIANGTFYNYFASQQDLFDQLLPEMGDDLIDAIRTESRGETDSIRREEIGFRAFFDFLARNPGFYRVLNEGETFAPKAYADHMDNMASGFLRALRKAKAKGELRAFADRELEVIVYILLAARNYLAYRYTFQNSKAGRPPDWVVQAYVKFLQGGLSGSVPGGRPARVRQRGEASGERFTVLFEEAGRAEVAMRVDDAALDDSGLIDRGAIAALVERAGTHALGLAAGSNPSLTSISINFTGSSHARSLIAKAQRTSTGPNLAHVTVNVFEQVGPAENAFATGIAAFAVGISGHPG